MAVIADRCPHVKVTVIDINADRIAAWNSDQLPIYEPGLDDGRRRARGRNLFFSTDVAGGIRAADIIFVSVNTPTKTFGEGAGRAADLQYWEKTARRSWRSPDRGKIVVEKSTLPVRTAEAMARILNSQRQGPALPGAVESRVPRRGQRDRGSRGTRPRADRLRGDAGGPRARGRRSSTSTRSWVPREPHHRVERLERRAVEAHRQRLPGAAHLVDQQHLRAVREDRGRRRRGGRRDRHRLPHRPEVPQGRASASAARASRRTSSISSTSPRATASPRSRATGKSVVRMNEWQEARFVRNMLASMFNTVAGKRIALFGFAFKAEHRRHARVAGARRRHGPARRARPRRHHRSRRRSTTRATDLAGVAGDRASSRRIPTRRRPALTPSPC